MQKKKKLSRLFIIQNEMIFFFLNYEITLRSETFMESIKNTSNSQLCICVYVRGSGTQYMCISLVLWKYPINSYK